MEQSRKLPNALQSLQDSDLASEVLAEWAQASSLTGVPRKREIDPKRDLLRMDSVQGSGFAFPGIVRGVPPRAQDGADDSKSDRKTSFDESSSAK